MQGAKTVLQKIEELKNKDSLSAKSANRQKSPVTATLHRPSPVTQSNVSKGSSQFQNMHVQKYDQTEPCTANVISDVKGQSTGTLLEEEVPAVLELRRVFEANDAMNGNPDSTRQRIFQKPASLNTDRRTGIQRPPGFTDAGSGAQRSCTITEHEARIHHQVESRPAHGSSRRTDQEATRTGKNGFFQQENQFTPQKRVPDMPNNANQQQDRDHGILGRHASDTLQRQATHVRRPPGFSGNR